MTNILQTKQEIVDHIHRKIHVGQTFTAFWRNEDGSPVADNAIFGIVIQTGPLAPQLNYSIACGGDVEALLYEAPTLTVTGTTLLIYNVNRLSGVGSTLNAWHSPTVATGTFLSDILQPGGLANVGAGGMVREESHWILNTGTFYFIGGVNRGGGNQPASATLQWYEEALATDGSEL